MSSQQSRRSTKQTKLTQATLSNNLIVSVRPTTADATAADNLAALANLPVPEDHDLYDTTPPPQPTTSTNHYLAAPTGSNASNSSSRSVSPALSTRRVNGTVPRVYDGPGSTSICRTLIRILSH
jgi:hypothetical protein